MAGQLDFYFFYGSIHSYLSVMRIGALASAAGVAVRWQPFNLREILIEQNNTAFTKNDVKMNYFWHDVERRAPPQHPVRRPGAIPGRSRSQRVAGRPHRGAGKMVRRLLALDVSRMVHPEARAGCRRSHRAHSCL